MDQIIINGIAFRDIPSYCGYCPAYIRYNDKQGFCSWFDKQKWNYNNVPKRCAALFEKALAHGPGEYVITLK